MLILLRLESYASRLRLLLWGFVVSLKPLVSPAKPVLRQAVYFANTMGCIFVVSAPERFLGSGLVPRGGVLGGPMFRTYKEDLLYGFIKPRCS